MKIVRQHLKIFNSSHQKEANSKHSEVLVHTHKNSYIKKTGMLNVSKDTEQKSLTLP